MFTQLTPANGGYYAVVLLPNASFTFSPAHQGSDTSIDSDIINKNSTAGSTAQIVLFSGLTTSGSSDAALYIYSEVNGCVFDDANANGVRDTEVGISGASVTLYNSSGAVVATVSTGANGCYNITGVIPGTCYVIHVDLTTPFDRHSPSGADSNVNSVTGNSSCFTITSGQSPKSVNAGMYQTSIISGIVWNDINGDGIRSSTVSDPGLSGVVVQLYNSSGALLSTVATNNTGYYSFAQLTPAASYVIGVVLPNSSFAYSPAHQGTALTDSDVINFVSGTTASITPVEGQNVVGQSDAGLFIYSEVNGCVFNDSNADGFRQLAELSVSGVNVSLYNSSGALVGSTLTGANGCYNITNVRPGTCYTIQVTLLDPFNRFSPQTVDSNVDTTTGISSCLVITSGLPPVHVNAGMYQSTALSGIVWNDLNRDGIRTSDEGGFLNVVVQLFNFSTGAFVASVATNNTGYYMFTQLTPANEATMLLWCFPMLHLHSRLLIKEVIH